jgi:hypothetical protein
MLYREVEVMRDMATKINKTVAQHEVEILKHIFGPQWVKELRSEIVNRPYLPIEEERDRLNSAYGAEYVVEAYPNNQKLRQAYESPRWAFWLQKITPAPKLPKPTADLRTHETVPLHSERTPEYMVGLRAAIEEGIAQAGKRDDSHLRIV